MHDPGNHKNKDHADKPQPVPTEVFVDFFADKRAHEEHSQQLKAETHKNEAASRPIFHFLNPRDPGRFAFRSLRR